ncbi:MAG: YicC family protein [Clostridia bacterium]|nr:YicC family protein [Clostridia bacterium]
MIKSMTGFGRGIYDGEKRTVTVEIKSVNHRFLDFNLKIYRVYSKFEDKIRAAVSSKISRGKLDVYVSVVNKQEDGLDVKLDRSLLNGYLKAYGVLRDEYGLKDDISVMTVARNSDLFTVNKAEEDDNEVYADIEKALDLALCEFVAMREEEGRRLAEDLLSYLSVLEQNTKKLKELSPESVKEYRNKLEERIKELLEDAKVDEQRLLTETAIFADKIAVDEEMARLSSHFAQFRQMIESTAPIGKKMDFLVQEINREINTTGSKANSLEMSKTVVEMKSELEKIREQIQNVE